MYSREVVVSQAAMSEAAWDFIAEIEPGYSEVETTMVQGALVSAVLAKFQPVPMTSDVSLFGERWRAYQMPTFELSESLLAEFLLTDPGRVETRDIAWPFPAFRVQLPSPSHVHFSPLGGDGNVRSITVVDVNLAREDGEGAEATAPIGRARTVADLAAALRSSLREMVRIARKPSDPGKFMRIYDTYGDSAFTVVPWGGTHTVSYAFDIGTSESYVAGTPEAILAAEVQDEDRVALRACGRVMANLCLYLGAVRQDGGARIWSPTDKSSTREGKTWRLNGTVKLSREMREAATAAAAGRRIAMARHVVRGHFREQPFGPGRSQTRRIYIAPHWRGELEGAEERKYKAE